MQIKPGFLLRDLCGEQIIVAEGEENIDFSKIISLNETAAYLWQQMEGRSFDIADMVTALCREYDVEPQQATADCQLLADRWVEVGIVEA
jgi:hypothetical protein